MQGNVTLCLGKNTENETFTFQATIMNTSKEQSSHTKELCKKASQKMSALLRISNQLNDSEKKPSF